MRPRPDPLGLKADFQVADIEALPYPHASFDAVTAACVFWSVDDPVCGLREAAGVVRPRHPAHDLLVFLDQHRVMTTN